MANLDESDRTADTASTGQHTWSDSSEKSLKGTQIQQACEKQDLQLLVRLADSPGGLLDDQFRRLACKTLAINPRWQNQPGF